MSKFKHAALLALVVWSLCSFLKFSTYLPISPSSAMSYERHLGTGSLTALPPVHINASWIGNQWIPPPWYRLYSSQEFLDYFQYESVLFVGDSTARRMSATLHSLLKAAAATTPEERDATVQVLDDSRVLAFGKATEDDDSPIKVIRKSMPRRIGNCNGTGNNNNENNTTRQHQAIPTHLENRHFDYLGSNCLRSIRKLVEDPDSIVWRNQSNHNESTNTEPHYSLVVFIIGPWEIMEHVGCGSGQRLADTKRIFHKLFQYDGRTQDQTSGIHSRSYGGMRDHTRFVWRTWGTHGSTKNSPMSTENGWKKAAAHNQYVKELVHDHQQQLQEKDEAASKFLGQQTPHLSSATSYIDWADTMRLRLFPEDRRISGDIDPHYGLEARLTFAQMLLNHLVELDRQEKFRIPPWNTPGHIGSDDKINLDVEEFFATFPPLAAEDQARHEAVQRDFCAECIWKTYMTCEARQFFLNQKYKVPIHTAMMDVLTSSPQCNRTEISIALNTTTIGRF